MNSKDLLQAMEEISDARIAKAAQPPKRKTVYWYSAVAAMLVVAILLGVFQQTQTPPAYMENPSVPTFSTKPKPTEGPSPNFPEPTGNHIPVYTTLPQQPTQPSQPVPTTNCTVAPTIPVNRPTLSTTPGFVSLSAKEYNWPVYPKESSYVDASQQVNALSNYFAQIMHQCLTGDEDNAAFSPINLYMALAMLAETTGGESRAEILSVLGASSMEELRQQATKLWHSAYRTGEYPCLLANSLWLRDGGVYSKDVMQTLADTYYASAYGVDFRQDSAAEAVQNWINKQTAGMLQEQVSGLTFDPATLMSMVSTVYYKSLWNEPFYEEGNKQDVFHGTNGDVTRTFMNRESISYYYQGSDFGAMSLGLNGGAKMWLILPNEGKTPKDLLCSGEYAKLFLGGELSKQEARIALSLPKFDISCKQNLVKDLRELGVNAVFQPGTADFSPLTEADLFVNKVEQATRVAIDEKGVTAASYVIIDAVTSPMPPPLKVEFTLDRPFMFVITNITNVPLFAGTVKNP